jgi:hypothetical protein
MIVVAGPDVKTFWERRVLTLKLGEERVIEGVATRGPWVTSPNSGDGVQTLLADAPSLQRRRGNERASLIELVLATSTHPHLPYSEASG